MEKDKCCGGTGNSSPNSSSFVKAGDRQMFSVELRPGETTIISWKKLVKDVNKGSERTHAPDLPAVSLPAIQSPITSGQTNETELSDAPQPNRFGAVIEKIERLYVGNDSSDDKEILPDDDQYDTEDSFIDDAELDEYFEVDNSAIRHEGFFVNRGKLERLNEPSAFSTQQPKKRRRKDLIKDHDENDNDSPLIKQVKVGKTASGKTEKMVGKSFASTSKSNGASHECFEDIKLQSQKNPSGIPPRKKSADAKIVVDPSSSVKTYNDSSSTSSAGLKDIDQLQAGVILPKNLKNKPKESTGPSDGPHHKFDDRSGYVSSKFQSGRSLNSSEELESSQMEASFQFKQKNDIHEFPGMNVAEVNYHSSTKKSSNMNKKDGSNVKPRSSMLEKAISELEKMVAESRPPTMENQEVEAIKRRLPREIKLKLAKVARLAQASHEKISKELISRLMSILGHLMQLRTLKRNLKVMISTSQSAKQEHDDRFQQMKKEVVEMIKLHPSQEIKAVEKQVAASDNLKELGSDEKGVPKRKFSMEAVLEEKICDLYDLFVDGLDEDAGPQIRKLYVQLAELWPVGSMDSHGIKRAICRVKERRRALFDKHQLQDEEKIKRKKVLGAKTESVGINFDSFAQPQHVRERVPSVSGTHSLLASTKPVPIPTTTSSRTSNPSMKASNGLEGPKLEKLKGTSSSYMEDARSESTLTKKKVKRKPEASSDEIRARPEKLKLALQAGDERNKALKQSSGHPQKLNLQSTAALTLQQSS